MNKIYDINTRRINKINIENNLIVNKLRAKFDNGNNPAGDVSETLPDAYLEVLNWISSSFNEDLKSANGLAVGGTVMDQLVMALVPMYLMNSNFPQWLRDSLNPNTATGAGRRMICQILDVVIEEAKPTSVVLQIKGEANTVIAPMSLLISTPDTANPDLKIQFYNFDIIILDHTGFEMATFVCQQWGDVAITPENQYTIISQVAGVNSVEFNVDEGSDISIGQEEDTDEELKNKCFFSINQKAKNGYSVLENELIANLPSTAGIVTMINNNDVNSVLPDGYGVTAIPSNTIVVSLSCEDNQTNKDNIAETLFYNRTGVKYGYPSNIPNERKKTAIYTNNNIDYTFEWVQTDIVLVYFTVVINESNNQYNISDDDVKRAIINQFREGGYNHDKVVQGIPFYLQWFDQALSTLGLPSYDITMSFADKVNKTILCSPIWLLPAVEEASITIQWKSV
jgi:hypothetical protein